MALILFTFFLAPLSQLPPGCERGTYNGVDVYRCRGYDVALRGYLVSLSNCVPGDVFSEPGHSNPHHEPKERGFFNESGEGTFGLVITDSIKIFGAEKKE